MDSTFAGITLLLFGWGEVGTGLGLAGAGGMAVPQARHGCGSGGPSGLGGGDEGVRLDVHPVGGELDLAVHRRLPVAVRVRAAGDGAAEPLGPLGQGTEA